MSNRYVSLALAAGALGLLAPSASAQERVAVQGLSAVHEVNAFGGGDVLRNYDPTAEQTLYQMADGGFVYGTNSYGDLGKATCFEAPANEIEIQSVTAYMVASDVAAGIIYNLVIRDGAPGLEGEAGAGPGATQLYSQEFDTSELTTTAPPAQAVEHVLDTPLAVSTSFCVSFEWDAGWPHTEFGIVAEALPAEAAPSPHDWEMWSDGAWFNVNETWTDFRAVMMVDVNYTSKGSASEADPAAAASVRLAPNPTRGATTLTFSTVAPQAVTIEVLNLLGQRVATATQATVSAGDHTVALPTAGLASGTYVVRVAGEDFVATRRVVVLN